MKYFVRLSVSVSLILLSYQSAFAQTQTAQSAMVDISLSSASFEIQGTSTWTFDRGVHQEPGTAMAGYTNLATTGPSPVGCTGAGAGGVNCAAANAPTAEAIAAAQPLPNEIILQQHAQGERCTFFLGGQLTSMSYSQTARIPGANGKGDWQYEWSYELVPVSSIVDPFTAWTSEETGGTVDVGFSGFVASESFMKQSTRNKYSFTMTDGGISRARGLSATLSGPQGGAIDLNNLDSDGDTVNDAVVIVPATDDFTYLGNGGVFGNATVFNALHAALQKSANSASNILNGVNDNAPSDNFAGNNGDLAAGNVHTAPFGGLFGGLTESGDYTISVSGVLKGNSSTASQDFSVTSNLITIGGCTAVPQ
jgi:hypothetical protein